ncbi:uncharacterized protein LAJ45_01568 [Morchella importuna]|nr:uncharacterized protein LAJ45_01568 [Morchella importuna]KAH8153801.1 hypothetical protein LAJ45_01568 [Morchella importuna]
MDNNWAIRSSKMNGDRHSSPFTLSSSRSSSYESVGEDIDALEIVTPRTYSHSPSPIPQQPTDAELNPWLFQLFPETYADGTAYSSHPAEIQYIAGSDASSLYSGSNSTSIIGQPMLSSLGSDENIFSSAGINRSEEAFFQSYDDTQDYERPMRVRFSPFSEYDSSSSEYDRGSTPALSDYSPQFTSRSRANSTRSSPTPGFSPELGPGSASAPTSNPSYSHLVATFAAPKRRKSRRKLGPDERREVHQLRKMGACTRCWGLKMKCGEGNPCPRCEKLGAGALCVRVHFVDLDVFSKWLVDAYSRTMMHHVLRWANSPARTVTVSHEKSLGVTLSLNVYEFIPAYPGQLVYWYKDDVTGWQSVETTSYAMKRGINTDILEKYIDDHTWYYVENSFQGNPILAEIFQSALKYSKSEENFLLRDALQLWTATQLLIQGATLHPSSDSLGISPISSLTTPLAGQTPMPRVLANQLDHLIERRIWQLEKQILCELQKRIFGRKREDWLRIFLTLVVLMNALERDSWRLYYWVFHMDDGYAWRHPSSPQRLIEKNNILAESLAAHFSAISKGLTPFSLDWSREQTVALIGNCEDRQSMLESMERIGRGLRSPDHALRVENVLALYRESNESSLDFLYTSKVMVI